MNLLTCLLVLELFDPTVSINSKSVNLALETVLEFNNKDNSGDLQFINNIQTFLDKLKSVIHNAKGGRRYGGMDESFTGFIQSAIFILNSYDNDDLEDVFQVIDDEIRKYHYKGCKFYELIQNNNIRRFMAAALDDVKSQKAEQIKHMMRKLLRVLMQENYDSRVKDFIKYVNSLYRNDAVEKFRMVLINLDSYKSKSKRVNLNLVQIVRDGVRSLLFDHYTNLNQNARKELKLKIEAFWNDFFYPNYIKHKNMNVSYANGFSMPGINNFSALWYNLTHGNLALVNMSGLNTIPEQATTANSYVPWSPIIGNLLKLWPSVKITNRNNTDTMITATTWKSKYTSEEYSSSYSKKERLKKFFHDKKESIAAQTGILHKRDRNRQKHGHKTTADHTHLQTLWHERLTNRKTTKRHSVKNMFTHEAAVDVKKAAAYNHDKGNKHRKHKHKSKKVSKKHSNNRHTSRKHRNYATTKYRKAMHISSEEGLAIESFENSIRKRYLYRKNNINDTFTASTQTIDESILKRLNNLEKELTDIKSRLTTEKARKSIDRDNDKYQDKYELDFLTSTRISESSFGTSTTTPRTTKTVKSERFTVNNKRDFRFTTPSVIESDIDFKVNAQELKNVTIDGNVTKKASLSHNGSKIAPFKDERDNDTIENIEKQISLIKNNNVTVPSDSSGLPPQQPAIGRVKLSGISMLEHEQSQKRLESILNNITMESLSQWPTRPTYSLLSFSTPPDGKDPMMDPFNDIDGMDFK